MLWYFKKVLWLSRAFWSARNSSNTWAMVFSVAFMVLPPWTGSLFRL
jgi:hypothetical protein